ncbi:MAG: hypothetical protein Q8J88_15940 [Bacteroidales bacterium]|nr:hypothetical protein [Bacteroidales bacterium]
MQSKTKKIVKTGITLLLAGLLIGGGIGYYLFNMPHRDIRKVKTDYAVSVAEIVNEYLTEAETANAKYLSDDGNSKVLEISGSVYQISEDFNGRKVVLLKEEGMRAGVSCTFLIEASENATKLKIGQTTVIKGVIRSGANYIEDFDLYEHVILEQCDIVLNQ